MSGIVSQEEFRRYFGDMKVLPPVQRAGQDKVVRELLIGGVDSGSDMRFIADLPTLIRMVEVARRSPTQRCVVWGAGMNITVFRGTAGNLYSTFVMTGNRISTEQVPTGIVMGMSNSQLGRFRIPN